MNIKKILTATLIGFSALVFSGCASLQNVYPTTGIQAPMERSDYCILETVKGVSETRSYFFGILKVVNNKAIKNTSKKQDTVVMENQFSSFLGISEEPARYSNVAPPKNNIFTSLLGLIGIPPFPSTEDRAYFNALSVLPEEADSVLNKSFYKEIVRHVPLIYRHEITEFKGKAIRLKSDEDIRNKVSCTRIAKRG